MNKIDIQGKTFGYWKAIEYIPGTRNGKSSCWLCECRCGRRRYISVTNLTHGKSKSCGCMRSGKQMTPDTNRKEKTRKKEQSKKTSQMSIADMLRLSQMEKSRGGKVTTYSATHPPYMYTSLCPDLHYRDST